MAAVNELFSWNVGSMRLRWDPGATHPDRDHRADCETGIGHNLALDMSRFARPSVQKRSYSADRVEEVWQVLFTSGSDDLEFDAQAVGFFLETAGRCSAPVKARVGGLRVNELKVR